MSMRPMSQQVTTIGVNNTANDDCNKLSWKQKQKTSKEIIWSQRHMPFKSFT